MLNFWKYGRAGEESQFTVHTHPGQLSQFSNWGGGGGLSQITVHTHPGQLSQFSIGGGGGLSQFTVHTHPGQLSQFSILGGGGGGGFHNSQCARILASFQSLILSIHISHSILHIKET